MVNENGGLLAWCVAANVAREIPGGVKLRLGTKPLARTKVWVLPPQWRNGGEKVAL